MIYSALSPNKRQSQGYWVSKAFSGNDDQVTSGIENLPKLLLSFNTEYHFIFKQLYDFVNNPTPSIHEAYTAPSLIRKFLETYLGFKLPEAKTWSDKLNILFELESDCIEIKKFADDAAHAQSVSRGLINPEYIPSAKSIIKKVMDAIEEKDALHFNGLISAIS